MPQSESGSSRTKGKGKLRKVICTVRDSVLEQWPILKPGCKWFSDEASAVKRGWVFFGVLALVLVTATWWGTSSYEEKRIARIHDARMAKKPEYDKVLDKYYTDATALLENTSSAFEDGDYAYCVVFYERAVALSSDRNILVAQPLYVMAKFASNPTPQGVSDFHNNLNALVEDLKKHHDAKAYLSYLISNLNRIRKRVSDPEREFVNQITDKVVEIKAKAPD